MFYKITNSIPANTASTAAQWNKLHVCKGTLVEYIIYAPPECADLLNFRVEYQGTQILPFNRGEWINAFYPAVIIKENLDLEYSPFVLDVYAYNDDTLYEHEYNFYANILRDEPVSVPPASTGWFERWAKLLGGG